MSGGTLLLIAIAVCVAGIAFFLFRASGRLTAAVWAVVLFFVPVWMGVTVGFFWSAITLLTLAAVLTSISDIRLTAADLLMAVFALMVAVLFALKMATLSATVIAVLEWVLPYVWGRLVLARVKRSFIVKTIATVAAVAAVLGVIEFATGTNVFVEFLRMNNGLYSAWGGLQLRAGRLRVEGAWGHSIALGAAFAMSSAFVVAARWRVAVRAVLLAVLMAAAVMTISRIGMLTLVVTVALSVTLLPGIEKSMRWTVAGMGAVAAVLVIPFIGDVFAEAGSEAGGSADYRGSLFTLFSQVRLFGGAGDWTGLTVGGDYLGTYAKSVDNAFLVFALRFGWVPSLLLLAVLVLAAVTMVGAGKASPPAIAVAVQLPALFAVALITQSGMYLLFLAGLAIAWRQESPDDDQDGSRLSIRRMNPVSVFASRR